MAHGEDDAFRESGSRETNNKKNTLRMKLAHDAEWSSMETEFQTQTRGSTDGISKGSTVPENSSPGGCGNDGVDVPGSETLSL